MAGAPPPTLIIVAFGTGAPSANLQSPIPVSGAASGRAAYLGGFPPITAVAEAAGGQPPQIADFNGIFDDITSNIVAMTGGQYQPFSNIWAEQNGGYASGAIVPSTTGNGYWLNITTGNVENPDTTPAATSGWVPLAFYGTGTNNPAGGTLTLPAIVAAQPILIFNGTLTSNLQAILPPWVRDWLIINASSGNYSVTVKTAAGTGVLIPAGGSAFPTAVYGDGTNINLLYSTLGNIVVSRSTTASITSNATPAADSQLVTPVLPPGSYRCQARLWLAAASGGTNPGIQAFIATNAGSASGIGTISGLINGIAVAASTDTSLPIGEGFSMIETSTVTPDYLAIEATLTLASVGTISVNWAQNLSSTSAAKLLAGSSLTVQAMQG